MFHVPVRSEAKNIRLLSGLQTGKLSFPASKVNRVGAPLTASNNQTLALPFSWRCTATRLPFGDNWTFSCKFLSLIAFKALPERSNQINRLAPANPVRYATIPAVAAKAGALLSKGIWVATERAR